MDIEKYNQIKSYKYNINMSPAEKKIKDIYFIRALFNRRRELILTGYALGATTFWYSETDLGDEVANELILYHLISGSWNKEVPSHYLTPWSDPFKEHYRSIIEPYNGYWTSTTGSVYDGGTRETAAKLASDLKKTYSNVCYMCMADESENKVFGRLSGYLFDLKKAGDSSNYYMVQDIISAVENQRYLVMSEDSSIRRLYAECYDLCQMFEARRIIDEDR